MRPRKTLVPPASLLTVALLGPAALLAKDAVTTARGGAVARPWVEEPRREPAAVPAAGAARERASGEPGTIGSDLPPTLPSGQVASPVVALQPFGALDPVVLATVADHVRSLLAADVAILPPRPLPDSAYYAPRHRYRGDDLLAFLDRATPPGYSRVIGITDRDISVTNGPVYDWGVFGVARLSGRPGVVSTFRLGATSVPVPLLRTRLEKVVVHELGHTFGLPHCSSAGCVMRDAEGSIRPVDSSTGRLCPSCATRLAELLGKRT